MANSVIDVNLPQANLPVLAMDAEVLPGAGPAGQDIYRERIQVCGDTLPEVARVLDTPPAAGDYGLVVRPIEGGSTSAGPVLVPASLVAVSLLAANPSRKGLIIVNNSSVTLYVSTGPIVTTALWTVNLTPGRYWECPFKYDGVVMGIWATAVGNAMVTEFV